MKLTRLKTIVSVIIIAIILTVVFAASHGKKTNYSVNNFKPPQAAVMIVEQYLQLSEDAVGADQFSPISWLPQVQPLVTPAWYSHLQPNPNTPTGSVSRDYYTAHTNNWVVMAIATNCIWDTKTVRPTASSGIITCKLSDKTLSRTTKAPIPVASIPFGWGHNGEQPPPDIKVLNQNGKWLVDSTTVASIE